MFNRLDVGLGLHGLRSCRIVLVGLLAIRLVPVPCCMWWAVSSGWVGLFRGLDAGSASAIVVGAVGHMAHVLWCRAVQLKLIAVAMAGFCAVRCDAMRYAVASLSVVWRLRGGHVVVVRKLCSVARWLSSGRIGWAAWSS